MITVYIIIGISVYMSYTAWNNSNAMQRWVFSAYVIDRDKSYFRFITSGFIHADGVHLFINMLTFYFFAPNVLIMFSQRTTFGVFTFICLYFLAVIGSEIPSFFKHRNNPSYSSLGASGGVSALVFSSILYRPDATFSLYFILDLPAIVFGVLYILYTYYAEKKGGDGINHSAHFWGAVIGIIFTFLVDPDVFYIFISRLENMF